MEISGDSNVKHYSLSEMSNKDKKYIIECGKMVECLNMNDIMKIQIKENSVFIEMCSKDVNINSNVIRRSQILRDLLNIDESEIINKIEKKERKEKEREKLIEEMIIENDQIEEMDKVKYINRIKEEKFYFNVYHVLDKTIEEWLNMELESELLLKENDLYIYHRINK